MSDTEDTAPRLNVKLSCEPFSWKKYILFFIHQLRNFKECQVIASDV